MQIRMGHKNNWKAITWLLYIRYVFFLSYFLSVKVNEAIDLFSIGSDDLSAYVHVHTLYTYNNFSLATKEIRIEFNSFYF